MQSHFEARTPGHFPIKENTLFSVREDTCLLSEHVPEGESAERLHFALHSSACATVRSAQVGDSLSTQSVGRPPQEKRSRGVVTAQHDSRIRDDPLAAFSRDENLNHTHIHTHPPTHKSRCSRTTESLGLFSLFLSRATENIRFPPVASSVPRKSRRQGPRVHPSNARPRIPRRDTRGTRRFLFLSSFLKPKAANRFSGYIVRACAAVCVCADETLRNGFICRYGEKCDSLDRSPLAREKWTFKLRFSLRHRKLAAEVSAVDSPAMIT